jgi:hypothetical protein
MHVMMPREKWTDERLDDLNQKVDAGSTRIGNDVSELQGEMNTRFSEARNEMNNRFGELRNEMNTRFDSVQRSYYAGVIAIVAALIATRAL